MTELVDGVACEAAGTDAPMHLTERERKHDLRQSLAAMAFISAVLDRGSVKDPRTGAWLEMLRKEVDWMGRLLSPDSGAEAASPVELGALATRVWESVAGRSPCAMHLSRATGLWVSTTAVDLERCLRNLLDNAVRAAGPQGVVLVRAERLGGSVAVEVADSGPGFGRVPAQERLGLRSVIRYANDSGGVVLVGDSPLGGASVRLVLPADLSATPAQGWGSACGS